MRSRTLQLVLVVVCAVVSGAVYGAPAGAVDRAKRGHKSVNVSFPLPPVNTSGIEVATVKAKAPKGEKLGRLKVKTTNEDELGSVSISAVYVTQGPAKPSRSGTFKVYSLVRRFNSKAPDSRRGALATLDALFRNANANRMTVTDQPSEADCADAGTLDELPFSSDEHEVTSDGSQWDLFAALSKALQTTNPFEIFGDVLAAFTDAHSCR